MDGIVPITRKTRRRKKKSIRLQPKLPLILPKPMSDAYSAPILGYSYTENPREIILESGHLISADGNDPKTQCKGSEIETTSVNCENSSECKSLSADTETTPTLVINSVRGSVDEEFIHSGNADFAFPSNDKNENQLMGTRKFTSPQFSYINHCGNGHFPSREKQISTRFYSDQNNLTTKYGKIVPNKNIVNLASRNETGSAVNQEAKRSKCGTVFAKVVDLDCEELEKNLNPTALSSSNSNSVLSPVSLTSREYKYRRLRSRRKISKNNFDQNIDALQTIAPKDKVIEPQSKCATTILIGQEYKEATSRELLLTKVSNPTSDRVKSNSHSTVFNNPTEAKRLSIAGVCLADRSHKELPLNSPRNAGRNVYSTPTSLVRKYRNVLPKSKIAINSATNEGLDNLKDIQSKEVPNAEAASSKMTNSNADILKNKMVAIRSPNNVKAKSSGEQYLETSGNQRQQLNNHGKLSKDFCSHQKTLQAIYRKIASKVPTSTQDTMVKLNCEENSKFNFLTTCVNSDELRNRNMSQNVTSANNDSTKMCSRHRVSYKTETSRDALVYSSVNKTPKTSSASVKFHHLSKRVKSKGNIIKLSEEMVQKRQQNILKKYPIIAPKGMAILCPVGNFTTDKTVDCSSPNINDERTASKEYIEMSELPCKEEREDLGANDLAFLIKDNNADHEIMKGEEKLTSAAEYDPVNNKLNDTINVEVKSEPPEEIILDCEEHMKLDSSGTFAEERSDLLTNDSFKIESISEGMMKAKLISSNQKDYILPEPIGHFLGDFTAVDNGITNDNTKSKAEISVETPNRLQKKYCDSDVSGAVDLDDKDDTIKLVIKEVCGADDLTEVMAAGHAHLKSSPPVSNDEKDGLKIADFIKASAPAAVSSSTDDSNVVLFKSNPHYIKYSKKLNKAEAISLPQSYERKNENRKFFLENRRKLLRTTKYCKIIPRAQSTQQVQTANLSCDGKTTYCEVYPSKKADLNFDQQSSRKTCQNVINAGDSLSKACGRTRMFHLTDISNGKNIDGSSQTGNVPKECSKMPEFVCKTEKVDLDVDNSVISAKGNGATSETSGVKENLTPAKKCNPVNELNEIKVNNESEIPKEALIGCEQQIELDNSGQHAKPRTELPGGFLKTDSASGNMTTSELTSSNQNGYTDFILPKTVCQPVINSSANVSLVTNRHSKLESEAPVIITNRLSKIYGDNCVESLTKRTLLDDLLPKSEKSSENCVKSLTKKGILDDLLPKSEKSNENCVESLTKKGSLDDLLPKSFSKTSNSEVRCKDACIKISHDNPIALDIKKTLNTNMMDTYGVNHAKKEAAECLHLEPSLSTAGTCNGNVYSFSDKLAKISQKASQTSVSEAGSMKEFSVESSPQKSLNQHSVPPANLLLTKAYEFAESCDFDEKFIENVSGFGLENRVDSEAVDKYSFESIILMGILDLVKKEEFAELMSRVKEICKLKNNDKSKFITKENSVCNKDSKFPPAWTDLENGNSSEDIIVLDRMGDIKKKVQTHASPLKLKGSDCVSVTSSGKLKSNNAVENSFHVKGEQLDLVQSKAFESVTKQNHTNTFNVMRDSDKSINLNKISRKSPCKRIRKSNLLEAYHPDIKRKGSVMEEARFRHSVSGSYRQIIGKVCCPSVEYADRTESEGKRERKVPLLEQSLQADYPEKTSVQGTSNLGFSKGEALVNKSNEDRLQMVNIKKSSHKHHHSKNGDDICGGKGSKKEEFLDHLGLKPITFKQSPKKKNFKYMLKILDGRIMKYLTNPGICLSSVRNFYNYLKWRNDRKGNHQ